MKQGWEIKKLGEVCDILDSQRKPVTKKDRKEGIYPYYGATGIQDYVDAYIFDGRYLLVGEDGAKWGAMDKTAFVVEGKCWVNNHAHILKVHDNLIDTFIEYYLVFKDLDEYITGAIVRKLTQQALREIPIPVPPIAEQEKIVAELDCLSGIIEKKKQQLKELDALAQSIFYEMFGDPVENDKGWETKKVIDVVKLQRGYDLPIQHRQSDGGIPVWGSNGIVGWHNEAKVDYGVITGRSGTLGTVYSYDKPFFPVNTTLFSVNTHGNDIVYLKYLLNIFDLKRFGTGTGVPTLNRNVFHSEPIISVPLALQQDFASKIEAIEKQKELIANSIKETETLFNSRMDYYFN